MDRGGEMPVVALPSGSMVSLVRTAGGAPSMHLGEQAAASAVPTARMLASVDAQQPLRQARRARATSLDCRIVKIPTSGASLKRARTERFVKSCLLLAGISISLVGGATAWAAKQAAVKDPSQLLIIDCLLPGQVRKLGGQMTYLSPRRPAKTSASDCEIRGGEYVAYDRANYATALQVWLPQAEEGDPKAQTYVGEIFEKGLGRPTDPATAATWYLKAADQGFSRAQSNLAYLYEQGLGVEQDRVKALNLYRLSAGLPADDGLVFASELRDAEARIDALSLELQTEVAEAEELRQELADSQQLAESRRASLAAARSEATRLQAQVAEQKALASASPEQLAELRSREAALAARQTDIERQSQQLAILEESVRGRETTLTKRVAATEAGRVALQSQLGTQSAESASANARLAAAEERVRVSETRIQQLQADLDAERAAMATERNRLKGTATTAEKARIERAQLEASLRERDARTRQQQALIDDLQAQNRTFAADVGRLKSEVDRLQAQNAQTEGTIQQQAAEVAQSRARLASTEQQLLTAQQQLDRLNVSLEQERRRAAAATAKAAGSAQLSTEVERLTRDLARLETQTIDYKARIAELSVQRNEYSNRVASASLDAPKVRSPNVPTSNLRAQLGLGAFYALIIGNNDYAYLPKLDTAVADAQNVEKLLSARYGFKTRTLMNATRAEILSALNDYRQQLRESDSLLVYYAGHGELAGSGQSAAWLPVNARQEDKTEWIFASNITDLVNEMPAKHVMIVADSCYSGPMLGRPMARVQRSNDLERLRDVAQLRSRLVLTSGVNAPVLDGGGGDHSVFARAFIDALTRNQGVLEASSLYVAIFEPVRQGARRMRFEQTPSLAALQAANHVAGGQFLFVPQA